jgi:hypothetical protein
MRSNGERDPGTSSQPTLMRAGRLAIAIVLLVAPIALCPISPAGDVTPLVSKHCVAARGRSSEARGLASQTSKRPDAHCDRRDHLGLSD